MIYVRNVQYVHDTNNYSARNSNLVWWLPDTDCYRIRTGKRKHGKSVPYQFSSGMDGDRLDLRILPVRKIIRIQKKEPEGSFLNFKELTVFAPFVKTVLLPKALRVVFHV